MNGGTARTGTRGMNAIILFGCGDLNLNQDCDVLFNQGNKYMAKVTLVFPFLFPERADFLT